MTTWVLTSKQNKVPIKCAEDKFQSHLNKVTWLHCASKFPVYKNDLFFFFIYLKLLLSVYYTNCNWLPDSVYTLKRQGWVIFQLLLLTAQNRCTYYLSIYNIQTVYTVSDSGGQDEGRQHDRQGWACSLCLVPSVCVTPFPHQNYNLCVCLLCIWVDISEAGPPLCSAAWSERGSATAHLWNDRLNTDYSWRINGTVWYVYMG